MNYFEFYELPVSFSPDMTFVKQRFYALSKQYHPDFHINESHEKQDEVLRLSTLNNNAYKVLSNPQLRLEYILQLNDLLPEGESYTLPQEFLMDMMEVNEELMELEFEPDAVAIDQLSTKIASIKAAQDEEIDLLSADFGKKADDDKHILLKIKDLYYRGKYISRINTNLAGIKEKI